jgi:hypothetical protein
MRTEVMQAIFILNELLSPYRSFEDYLIPEVKKLLQHEKMNREVKEE